MERQDRPDCRPRSRPSPPPRQRRRGRSRRWPTRSAPRRRRVRPARAARHWPRGGERGGDPTPRPAPRATVAKSSAWRSVRGRSSACWRWDQTPASRTPGLVRRRPATAAIRLGSRPARPRPVSTSRWIRSARRGRGPRSPRQAAAAASTIRSRAGSPDALTASPRRIAGATVSGGIAYRHRRGARRPPARSSTASSKVATENPSAPAASRASPTGSAPWP